MQHLDTDLFLGLMEGFRFVDDRYLFPAVAVLN